MAHRRVYSPRRLRLVLLLLSLVTLPAVLGSAVLVYYYMRFSTLVEKRLHGERWQAPSRLYARPQVLKPGTSLTSEELVRSLNSLKYEQRDGGLHAPGEFALRDKGVVALFPRAVPGGASEVLLASFTDKGLKDLRGEKTKRAYTEQPLEPELITYLFDDAPREKRRRVTFQELPDLLVKAVLAIEDRRFFSHPGLDPIGIVSAALKNIQAESWVRGGSTTARFSESSQALSAAMITFEEFGRTSTSSTGTARMPARSSAVEGFIVSPPGTTVAPISVNSDSSPSPLPTTTTPVR